MFLRWRSKTEASLVKLQGLEQSGALWLVSVERSRRYRLMHSCWSRWRSFQLHSVELRLERIREMVDFADSRADDAEVKAGKALSKADAALWQVRLELKEQRELAQKEGTRKELQVQALRSEIEHISETLRNVRRDLSIEKAALISQKAETAQVVRSLTSSEMNTRSGSRLAARRCCKDECADCAKAARAH